MKYLLMIVLPAYILYTACIIDLCLDVKNNRRKKTDTTFVMRPAYNFRNHDLVMIDSVITEMIKQLRTDSCTPKKMKK